MLLWIRLNSKELAYYWIAETVDVPSLAHHSKIGTHFIHAARVGISPTAGHAVQVVQGLIWSAVVVFRYGCHSRRQGHHRPDIGEGLFAFGKPLGIRACTFIAINTGDKHPKRIRVLRGFIQCFQRIFLWCKSHFHWGVDDPIVVYAVRVRSW